MYCRKCGNALAPTDAFCKNCGEAVTPSQPTQPVMTTPVETTPVTPEPVVPTPVAPQPVEPTIPEPVVAPIQESVTPTPMPVSNQAPAPAAGPVPAPNQVQQPVTMPTANQAPAPVAPKNNNTFIIIVIILAVVILILLGTVLPKKFGGSSSSSSSGDNTGNTGSINNSNNVATNVYNYKDYELPLPSGYEASTDYAADHLTLLNDSEQIAVATMIVAGYTIEDAILEKEGIRQTLEQADLHVTSVEEKTYAGQKWLIFNYKHETDGQSRDYYEALTGLGSYNLTINAVANFGSSSQDKILTDFSNMYKNATYKGSRNFSPEDKTGNLASQITPDLNLSAFDKQSE